MTPTKVARDWWLSMCFADYTLVFLSNVMMNLLFH